MPARIKINLSKQQLDLLDDDRLLASYTISSASNGSGETMGSGCTPRGQHKIRIAIGEGCENNRVFIGRRQSGEIYSEELAAQQPERDWVLTRILWLTGCESGRNRGGNVDTLRRYIYIHGTPDSEPMGIPKSHGCIRMRNIDLIALYKRVGVGTPVEIVDD